MKPHTDIYVYIVYPGAKGVTKAGDLTMDSCWAMAGASDFT
jgi:hypothetical protein